MKLQQDKPLVSVCVPVYNGERFIKDALDSIIAQSYPHKEIIVSDNASTDKTPDIAQRYVKEYGIKYSRSEQFLPASEYNFNRCLELSGGELISVYHADDIYNPEIVSRSVEMFRKRRGIGAALTMANVIDENGKILERYHLPKELARMNKDVYNLDEIFHSALKYGNTFLICPSAMIKRSVCKEVNGWDYGRYKSAADLGLWLKIAGKHGVAIIDAPLMNYRISAAQDSDAISRRRTDQAHYFLVMDDYADKIIGHKFKKYYTIHKIVDLTYRALNLSADSQIGASGRLIREALSLYFKNFFKIAGSFKGIASLFTIAFLFFANRAPRHKIRVVFRDFIFQTNDKRRNLRFALEKITRHPKEAI